MDYRPNTVGTPYTPLELAEMVDTREYYHALQQRQLELEREQAAEDDDYLGVC